MLGQVKRCLFQHVFLHKTKNKSNDFFMTKVLEQTKGVKVDAAIGGQDHIVKCSFVVYNDEN